MLAYQIEQLKEDISGKEVGLKSCEGSLTKCNKKVEQLRVEVQAGVARVSDLKADIAALRQEEARLNRIVQVGSPSRVLLVLCKQTECLLYFEFRIYCRIFSLGRDLRRTMRRAP